MFLNISRVIFHNNKKVKVNGLMLLKKKFDKNTLCLRILKSKLVKLARFCISPLKIPITPLVQRRDGDDGVSSVGKTPILNFPMDSLYKI